MFKKLAASLLAGVVSSFGVVATAPSASADTPGCVTVREYRSVYDGMPLRRVDYIFDTFGELVSQGGGYMRREYRPCAGDRYYSYVDVYYRYYNGTWRVYYKDIYISR